MTNSKIVFSRSGRWTSLPSASRRATSLTTRTLIVLTAIGIMFGAETTRIALTADHWKTEGNAEFVQKDGLETLELKPRNAQLKLATGRAVLNDFVFRDGTIEYDVETSASMGAGFAFRQRDKDTWTKPLRGRR